MEDTSGRGSAWSAMHPRRTMNLEEQSGVVLTLGQALHVNGQSTDDTLSCNGAAQQQSWAARHDRSQLV
jgi:hypothetical protein